jgi:hypothetical protein
LHHAVREADKDLLRLLQCPAGVANIHAPAGVFCRHIFAPFITELTLLIVQPVQLFIDAS